VKPAPFAYHAPARVEDALELLADLGDGARPLAGGQSLMPLLNLRLVRPDAIVDLNTISELAYHRLEDGVLVIGALCRQRDLERDRGVLAHYAAIADAVPLIGHVGIRNRGTVIGSLTHADPAAEWPVLALLLDATIVVARAGSRRRSIAARDWFKGVFATDLQTGELAVEARIPLPAAGTGTAFVEVARRHGDFALGSAAALMRLDGGGRVVESRLALGGFDSVPVLATPDPAAVGSEISPVDDIHATADYRRRLAATLAERALRLAEQRARETAAG
jgi:aerobic carbon-monoxide dehydrogenase medium subunit